MVATDTGSISDSHGAAGSMQGWNHWAGLSLKTYAVLSAACAQLLIRYCCGMVKCHTTASEAHTCSCRNHSPPALSRCHPGLQMLPKKADKYQAGPSRQVAREQIPAETGTSWSGWWMRSFSLFSVAQKLT